MIHKKGLRCSEEWLKTLIYTSLEPYQIEPTKEIIEEVFQKIQENYILLPEFRENA